MKRTRLCLRTSTSAALAILLGFTASMRGKTPPVEYELAFPSQGMALGTDGQILVSNIHIPTAWQTGRVEITAVDASKEVNPASDAAAVSIVRSVSIQRGNSVASCTVPLTITAAGEFGVLLRVSLVKTDGSTVAFTTAVSILAEDGRVWFGLGDVSDAAVNRARLRAGIQASPRETALPSDAQSEVERWEAERLQKRMANKNALPQ